LLNFNLFASITTLFNYTFYANFLDFQQLNDLLRRMTCKCMTRKIFFQLKLCFGNFRHFLSFNFLSIFDNFVDFQKVFLGMRTNLSSSSENDLVLDFFPVFSVTNNSCNKIEKLPFKNFRCS
jgi:hypothetical protein